MTYASAYYGGITVTGAATAVDSNGSITCRVGSNKIVSITCNQTVTDLTLTFTVETKTKLDIATVANGAITKSGTTATLQLTSAMTTVERTLPWSLVATETDENVAEGLMFVTYDAQGD